MTTNLSSRTLRIFILILILISSASVSSAQNKVVVIPLFEEGEAPWKGSWEIDTQYSTSDVVEEGGSSYISLIDHESDLSNIPPMLGVWDLLAASGSTGQTGSRGEDGDQGPMGMAGLAGANGNDGAKGDPGDAGAQGEKGDKGDQGDSVFSISGDDIQSSNSGNVGIGVSPSQKLTVNGRIRIGDDFPIVEESGTIRYNSGGFEGYHLGEWRDLHETLISKTITRHSFTAGTAGASLQHGGPGSYVLAGQTAKPLYVSLPLPAGAKLRNVTLVAKDNSATHRFRLRIFHDTTFIDGSGTTSLFGTSAFTTGNQNISNRYEFKTINSSSTNILEGTQAGVHEGFYAVLDCVEENGQTPVTWIGADLQFSKITYRYER